MAQKIIFELKDKILKEDIDSSKKSNKTLKKANPNIEEASAALQVLGYRDKNIKEVIDKLNIEEDSVEDIIKKVLKEMQNI